MKFKVGDKVRLRNIEVGIRSSDGLTFLKGMNKIIGDSTYIREFRRTDHIKVEGSVYWHSIEWFDKITNWEKIII